MWVFVGSQIGQFIFFVEFEMNDDDDIISEWLQFINQFQWKSNFVVWARLPRPNNNNNDDNTNEKSIELKHSNKLHR